ncbi:MAG: peptidoglycan-associated lipoprotein [Chthoniobacter sp.]|jgi:peptidoglycan-associated lipoprotein|nr:peptidoglycan-associated lipoprotein [Chthoniobacter sp.]
MKFIAYLLSFALVGCCLSGCAKNKKGGPGSGVDGDYVSGSALPERTEGVSFLSSNVDRNKFAPVYFGFDAYTVSSGEHGKVEQVAQFMRSNGNSVIVAGFTDERGTPEYNRGLGERRAQAVREALIRAGADGGKIQTVSFGAEMPADAGSGEGAWAKNRRAEFGVVR